MRVLRLAVPGRYETAPGGHAGAPGMTDPLAAAITLTRAAVTVAALAAAGTAGVVSAARARTTGR